MLKLLIVIAVLLPSMVLAQGGQGAAEAAPDGTGTNPVDDAKAQAMALYTEGKSLFYAGKFSPALERFEAAEKLDQSAVLRFNVCRSFEALRKQAETVACFRIYIEKYPEDEGVGYANAFMAGIVPMPMPPSAPATCVIVLRDVPEDAVAKINSKPVDPTSPITTDCFEQRIEIMRGTKLIAGGRQAVTPTKETVWVYEPNTPVITNTPTPEPGLSTQKWLAIGAGGGAVVTGIFAGIFASQMSDASDKATGGQFDFGAKDDWESAQSRTYVSLGLTTLFAGTAAALWLLDNDKPAAARAANTNNFKVLPTGLTISW